MAYCPQSKHILSVEETKKRIFFPCSKEDHITISLRALTAREQARGKYHHY